MYDWERDRFITEERPDEERLRYLLGEAVPHLLYCRDHGINTILDATPAPWRGWPTLHAKVSRAADVHIVLSTGYYRQVEMGTYWVKRPEDSIWPFVAESSVEELADYCIREIVEGIHGTEHRAGAIKLGSSAPELTAAETKAFRAGARAQKATGVHVTTHCTKLGAETTQLALLDAEGVELDRVVIGHTAWHLMNADCRRKCVGWMRRGANFQPTNLGVKDSDPGGEGWRPLVEAIHEVFDAGLGSRLVLGLDSGYCSESSEFGPVKFLPPEPFSHMLTHTLPAFRAMGLAEEEERTMIRDNPRRILPVS
jgi:phosphotriesterase-related protein